jgi:hypothetical protein
MKFQPIMRDLSSRRRFLAWMGSAALTQRLGMPRSAIGAQTPEPVSIDTTWSGDSWDGWMTLDQRKVPIAWERNMGTIHLRKTIERTGHIVTRREYGDFKFEFEWKIAPGGNSGIKYRVRRYDDRMLGCEYQIYDGRNRSVERRNQTGSIYDLYEPDHSAMAKPPGEWNQGIILLKDNAIEHWLNGSKIVTAKIGDAEWDRRIAESKFNDVPNFAKNPRGRIMLTDHGSEVWYRELKFTEL